jgi:hypothetical protein
MINAQTILLILLLFYFISNNWFNNSIFNKKETTFIFISKLVTSTFLFYYFSDILQLENKNDLVVYYNQAIKLHGSINGNFTSILNILFGNDEPFNTILSSLSYWERDFDYGLPNDNKTMIKIHLFLILTVGKSILNHILIFNIISFYCYLKLCKSLFHLNIHKTVLVFIAFLPSLLIWTSSTYKESIAISLHLLIISIIIDLSVKKDLKKMFVLFLLLCLHVFIKPFYLILILPFTLVLVIKLFSQNLKWLNRSIIISILIITSISALTFKEHKSTKDEYKYGNKFNLYKFIEYKQDDFFYEAHHRKAKTILKLNRIEPTLKSSILTFKNVILNTFLTPSFIFPKKFISIPFLVENLILYLLFFYVLFQKRSFFDSNENTFLILGGLSICLFSGLITPVFGNLIKFKSIGYLYILLAFIKINFQNKTTDA